MSVSYGIINQLINEFHQRHDIPEFSARSLFNGYDAQFLNNAIEDTILSVSAVDTVYVDQSTDRVRVWTIVDDPGEYAYDQIYDAERSVINRFSSVVFDFLIIPRRGRDTRSLITINCAGWTRAVQLPKVP